MSKWVEAPQEQVDGAIALAIKEVLSGMYNNRLSTGNPDYIGDQDIADIIKEFHKLLESAGW